MLLLIKMWLELCWGCAIGYDYVYNNGVEKCIARRRRCVSIIEERCGTVTIDMCDSRTV